MKFYCSINLTSIDRFHLPKVEILLLEEAIRNSNKMLIFDD